MRPRPDRRDPSGRSTLIAIASLIVVIVVALLVERVAAIALVATGLPIEVARFQARSALTGVGFTTREADGVINHPVRRRIVLWLMLIGNAGFVTIVASLVSSLSDAGSGSELIVRVGIILGAMLVITFVARSRVFERGLTKLILRVFRRFTDLDVRDMVNLLQLTKDYAITELQVRPGDWVADKPLAQLHLPDEGVLVLGIQRADGSFIGAPRGGTVVHAYDMLLLYGRSAVLHDLDERPSGMRGDQAHDHAVEEQGAMMDDDPVPDGEA